MAREAATTSRTGFPVRLGAVSKRYRTGPEATITALDEVTLELAAGQTLAVTGPSGSGKSTLLHVVGAMDVPDRGAVTVGEFALSTMSERQRTDYRRRIGFVFQRFQLLPAVSALDNVLAPVLPYRVAFDKTARARELLAAVGLAGRDNALPSQLSGGQQQRVAIARALINEPGLVLADEPTGNLDQSTGAEVLDLLLGLQRETGLTLLIATHDPAVARRADQVIRLVDGRLA